MGNLGGGKGGSGGGVGGLKSKGSSKKGGKPCMSIGGLN